MQYEQELAKLNENQRAAVYDDSNACLVNANVGSGKTTILIAKIIYLHYVKQVSYEDMVVLTFTNKAANEIKQRLLALEPGLSQKELRFFGTFHSVALAMLKANAEMEDFLVIEPEEELVMAEQLIVEHSLTIKYKNRLKKRLEQAKSITDPKKQVSKYQDDLFSLLSLLEEEKKHQKKMNFDDLIINATKLARRSCLNCSWIIIDEVQDSDLMQLEFIDALKGKETHLFAVGDPNQVIYSFRGSASMVFFKLKERYQARELSLPLNYRSSLAILEAARSFLQYGGKIVGAREQGSPIIVKNHYDSFQEACYLADKIKKLHQEGVSYREIAVFYRVQNQSGAFENVFAKENIPYEVSLKKTVKDIPVLNWFLKLLRFCTNCEDLAAGMSVLSDSCYGTAVSEKEAIRQIREYGTGLSEQDSVQKSIQESIQESVHESEQELVQESVQRSAQKSIQKSAKKSVMISAQGQKLLSDMFQFRAVFHARKEPLLYEDFDDYFSFDYYLHPSSAGYQEDKKAITELITIIAEYSKEHSLDFLTGLSEFLNTSSLYGINILQKEIAKENDSVKLMTLHAAKGLEFSYVFIVGVNYGLIPLQTKSFEEDEEEQRLFFVGITRAKDYLELSYYTKPDQYRVVSGPSRYLRMIPARLLEEAGTDRKEVSLQELKKQVLKSREDHSERGKENEPEQVKNKVIGKIENIDDEHNENINIEQDENFNDEHNENMGVEQNENIDDGIEYIEVTHPNYGHGIVIKEDEMMITVKFDDYGEKEFIKAFAGLTYIRNS